MSDQQQSRTQAQKDAINLFNDGQGVMKSLVMGVLDMHDRNRNALDAMHDDTLAKAKEYIEDLMDIVATYEHEFVPSGKLIPYPYGEVRAFLNITLRDAGKDRDEFMRQEAERMENEQHTQ